MTFCFDFSNASDAELLALLSGDADDTVSTKIVTNTTARPVQSGRVLQMPLAGQRRAK